MAGAGPSQVPPTEDLTGTCWRDDMWLQSFGFISPVTALDYFALSPFYDRSSNNEAARQRGMRLEQIPATPGTEFILQDAQAPHLFVIRKQYRPVDGSFSNLAYYYILDGTIYQAPTLHAALRSRMERCMFTIKSAFSELQSDLDPLGAPATEMLCAEAEAALRLEQDAPLAYLTPEGREQQQKAERSVLATLLDFPLPYASANLTAAAVGGEEGGVLEGAPSAQPMGTPSPSMGALSGR